MKKRIAILSLALTVMISNLGLAFGDLENHWAKNSITYLKDKKLIMGYEDGNFNPDGNLTREEASAIISRLIGKEKESSNDSLIDIDGRWSTNSIKYLLNEGIVNGYPDSTFRPAEKITRAEFVSLVYKYLKNENKLSLGTSQVKFSDIGGNWAEDYIHVLAGMGAISGYPEGDFKPSNLITRAEASSVISKILAKQENIDIDSYDSEEDKKAQILKFIEANYKGKINIEELRDKSIEQIFEIIGDKYSEYMDEISYQNFKSNLKGEFVGIGVHLMANNKDQIEVFAVVDDSPASKAGIKPGDIIDSIDGEKYSGYEVFAFTKKLDGVVGTNLIIGLYTTDENGNQVYVNKSLTREAIKLRTVFPKMISDDIGYIRITQFENPTYSDYRDTIEDLKSKGAKSIILDLRYNGGGIVSSARGIADSLVSEGTLYLIKNTDGTENTIQANQNTIGLPVVILVNERTASASELIAASVKDHKAGNLVGTKTYGKGTIQTVVDLPDGTGFKLTVGEYYSPNGNRIHDIGVTPDFIIDMGSVENIGPDNIIHDKQLQKAVELLKQ